MNWNGGVKCPICGKSKSVEIHVCVKCRENFCRKYAHTKCPKVEDWRTREIYKPCLKCEYIKLPFSIKERLGMIIQQPVEPTILSELSCEI